MQKKKILMIMCIGALAGSMLVGCTPREQEVSGSSSRPQQTAGSSAGEENLSALPEAPIDAVAMSVNDNVSMTADTLAMVLQQNVAGAVPAPETEETTETTADATGKVTVPDVVGKRVKVAEAALKDAGLNVGSVTYSQNDKVESGQVISQSAKAGTSVDAKTTVNLVVSKGQGDVKVPSLSGVTADQAKKSITNAGLAVGSVTTQASDDVEEGRVISQAPKANAVAEKGSKVNIVVSSGPKKVSAPDVMGLDVTGATKKINEAGLYISNVSYEYSDTVESGKVMSQSVKAGTSVTAGSGMTITISKGKESVQVPNVVGMSTSKAREALKNAGLGAQYVEGSGSGTVVSQDYRAGDTVAEGTIVTYKD